MDMSFLTSTGTIVNPQLTAAVHDFLLSTLQLLLVGLTTAVTWGVRTWIKSMNSDWKKALAERLVAYASEKIADNDQKREYVAAQIAAKFPRISQDEISHLIEEAVVNLKSTKGAS